MDVRKKLITELAKEENFSFLLDLNDLMPEILIEIRAKLFESKLVFPEDWIGYKIIKDNEILNISKEKYSSDSFFRFSIYIGNEDRKLYYGITGPWVKSNSIPEIKILHSQIKSMTTQEQWRDKYKNEWIYKYFSQDNESLFTLIRNGQNIDFAILPFINEFFNTCSKLKTLLEKANETLQKN